MAIHLGDKLKAAQARKGLSGVELAKLLGTTPQQLSRWRNSRDLGFNLVLKICDELDITVSEFLA
jgi:transcriptional regulator with XRE-family HTH domain